jgi:hypothetical protein
MTPGRVELVTPGTDGPRFTYPSCSFAVERGEVLCWRCWTARGRRL